MKFHMSQACKNECDGHDLVTEILFSKLGSGLACTSPSFVVIITNLEEADGAEHVDPEEEGVEVAVRDVDDLVLLGRLREAVPEDEDGERD